MIRVISSIFICIQIPINYQFFIMKLKVSIRLLLFMGYLLSVISIEAQPKQLNNSGVVFVDGYLFQDSIQGITKIIKTMKSLENEVKPMITELEKLQAEYKSLETQIRGSNNADRNLVDKAEKIGRDISFKNEDLKTRYNKRYTQVMNPVYDEIAVVMKNWCKQSGYSALIDMSKITNGMLLWVDEEAVDKATVALIAYINSKVF